MPPGPCRQRRRVAGAGVKIEDSCRNLIRKETARAAAHNLRKFPIVRLDSAYPGGGSCRISKPQTGEKKGIEAEGKSLPGSKAFVPSCSTKSRFGREGKTGRRVNIPEVERRERESAISRKPHRIRFGPSAGREIGPMEPQIDFKEPSERTANQVIEGCQERGGVRHNGVFLGARQNGSSWTRAARIVWDSIGD